MKKNGKKVLVSLAATMLLASSVGHAQSFYYKVPKDCTSSGESTINCNYSNTNSNTRVIKYSLNNSSWNNNWYSKYNNTEKPTNPKVNNPEESQDTNTDNKENDNNPIDNNKNNTKPDDSNTGANSSVEMEVVKLVNIERQKEGLAPLTYSEELSKVAKLKSQDMADNNYFNHNSPTYGDPFTMMKNFGIKYSTAGENIAKGYFNAQSVMNGWMNSSGHRANIMNPSFGKIGVGYVEKNGTTYWTQMFTN